MSETTISGAEFKKQLRDGVPKLGLFVNSHSATLTEQLAHTGYDWLLIDTQHGPMGNRKEVGQLSRAAPDFEDRGRVGNLIVQKPGKSAGASFFDERALVIEVVVIGKRRLFVELLDDLGHVLAGVV